MKRAATVDMTQGGLFVKMLLFALPLAISSALQLLFNAVDVAVVGHFVGSQGQAAVGCNGPVVGMVVNMFVGVSIGTTVVISMAMGRQDSGRIHRAVHTSMVIAMAGGLFFLLLGLAVSRPLLAWMNTPADVMDGALLYLRVYCLGLPFIVVFNFGAAVLRCVGDTTRPLYALVASGLLNCALNLFFVLALGWGVASVAAATVISNVVASALVWRFLAAETGPLRLEWRALGVSKPEAREVMRIGVPAGVQSVVFAISNIVIQAALNRFGYAAVAGTAVAMNYDSLSYVVVMAFCQAAVTFISQNYGAGEYGRCRRAYLIAMGLAVAASGAMALSVWHWRDPFNAIFTPDAAVAAYAVIRMDYTTRWHFMICSYEVSAAALRGLGYSTPPAVITIVGTCLLRLAWVYTVCRRFTSFETLILVYLVSWAVTGASMVLLWFLTQRRLLR